MEVKGKTLAFSGRKEIYSPTNRTPEHQLNSLLCWLCISSTICKYLSNVHCFFYTSPFWIWKLPVVYSFPYFEPLCSAFFVIRDLSSVSDYYSPFCNVNTLHYTVKKTPSTWTEKQLEALRGKNFQTFIVWPLQPDVMQMSQPKPLSRAHVFAFGRSDICDALYDLWTCCSYSAWVYSEILLRNVNHFNKANGVELGCHQSRIQSCEIKGEGKLARCGNLFSVDNFKDTH